MADTGAFSHVVIDGKLLPSESAGVSVHDIALLRGYGCFEVVRAFDGRVFRLGGHVDRLARSAEALGIAFPPRGDIESWIAGRAAAAGDCIVRVVLTGGTDAGRPGTGSSVIVFAEPVPATPARLRVLPIEAPWHTDATPYRLTGAKTLSYAPNVATTLVAADSGFDDALLVGRSGLVLEGPTFGIGWVRDGVIETPSLDLGILESITRAAMVEVAARRGIELVEGHFQLDRLLESEEAFAMSTTKDILGVEFVGEVRLPDGPVTARLAAGFRELVEEELGAR